MTILINKLAELEKKKEQLIKKHKDLLVKIIEDIGLLHIDEKLLVGALAKLKKCSDENQQNELKIYMEYAEPYLKKFFRSRGNSKQKTTQNSN